MLHLSTNGPLRMVFEHPWDYFHPKDSASGFLLLFQLCFHIAQGHIPPQIARVFGGACILVMTKPLGGIYPIVVRETLYPFTNHAFCFQFHEAFATHFSPHQFGVASKGGCETVIHNIKCTLNLHLDRVVLQLDVANTFNSVSNEVIFQELYAACGDIIQLIPFICAFYTFESPLFYSHHENDVVIIPSAMGTHQGDFLGEALFALAHFRALHSTTNHFPSCLFPSIPNDIHIIGHIFIISSTCEHF